MAGAGGGLHELRRCEVAALFGTQPLVQLQRAGLLEQVDHGVAVAAEAQRAARVVQRTGRAEPVGQFPFGGGAEARGRLGVTEFGAVGVGQVRGVHDRGTTAERARVGQDLGRRPAKVRQARLVLGPLLGQVDVQGRVAGGAPVDDRGHLVRGDRPHAVDRRAEAYVAAGRLERVDPFRPRRRVAVAEPPLHADERSTVHCGRQVARVEQRDPDARVGRGRHEGGAHRVRVGVPAPARGVVHVVELADAGDAGEGQLGVHRAGERVVPVRVEAFGHRVHAVPPGPERAAAALGAPAQRAVERVRVCVREARQGEPGEPLRARWGRHTLCNRRKPAVRQLDEHIGDRTGTDPGQCGMEARHRHASSSSTSASASTPAAQSESVAYSAGACDTPVGLRTNSIAVST